MNLDMLQWINLLLLPTLYGILRIATTLERIKQQLVSHDKLDDVRFAEINRRVNALEKQKEGELQ